MASIDDMPTDGQTSLLPESDLLTEDPVVVAEAKSETPSLTVARSAPSLSVAVPRPAPTATTEAPAAMSVKPAPKAVKKDDTAPICYNCGNQTQRAGSCYVCTSCGSTTGCS
ncbi:MAG TPA: hypothetical protein VFC50_00885 [Candidatus Dormibacteraeota bacterium]|nr:hypothetical protein [Candidatus Dormibacteraeota bacterium]